MKRKHDPKTADNNNEKDLLDARENSEFEKVQNLSGERRDNINAREKDGSTILHLAAAKGYRNIVELLLKSGSEIEAQENNGATALHLAAVYGHAKVVKVFVENKANLNAQDKYGQTPAHLVVRVGQVNIDDSVNGHIEVFNILLKSGADYNKIKNEDGKTVFDIAKEKAESPPNYITPKESIQLPSLSKDQQR